MVQTALMSDKTRQRQVGDGPEQSRTNLIVNYLPLHMSHEEIGSLFQTIGEVASCRVMVDKKTGESMGYAFVKYRRPENAQRAIDTLNGLRLHNKILRVSYARPSSEAIQGTNLYVGSLPLDMTQQDLEAMFRPYGTIISLRVLMYDNCSEHTPGRSRGVGFVRFNLRTEAERAICELNGFTPQGATTSLIVKFATSFPDRSSTPTPLILPPKGMQRQECANHHWPKNHPRPVRIPDLFVYNLPQEIVEGDLWRLFGPYGAIRNVQIIRDKHTGRCKGYGFIAMVHYNEACRAIQLLNGCRYANRVLHVNFAKGY